MNLILFEPHELDRPLPRSDRRAIHLLDVLHRRPGGTFDAAVVDGPRGTGRLLAVDPDTLAFSFEPSVPPLPPAPLALIVGLPRPQTARDILRDATTAGIGALHFVATEKGDPNYLRSSLWSAGEWRRHVLAGAEQAFDSRLPEITFGRPLAAAVAAAPAGLRLALDNYEAPVRLGGVPPPAPGTVATLAVGPERGWSGPERDALRAAGFAFVHLGPRVLRTEAAVLAAVVLLRAKLGLM